MRGALAVAQQFKGSLFCQRKLLSREGRLENRTIDLKTDLDSQSLHDRSRGGARKGIQLKEETPGLKIRPGVLDSDDSLPHDSLATC